MRIAFAGLHFGAEFVPMYQQHPDVEQVAVCDLDEARLMRVGAQFGIADRFTRLEDILDDALRRGALVYLRFFRTEEPKNQRTEKQEPLHAPRSTLHPFTCSSAPF